MLWQRKGLQEGKCCTRPDTQTNMLSGMWLVPGRLAELLLKACLKFTCGGGTLQHYGNKEACLYDLLQVLLDIERQILVAAFSSLSHLVHSRSRAAKAEPTCSTQCEYSSAQNHFSSSEKKVCIPDTSGRIVPHVPPSG